jgi:4-amino-4-deoxy-L-arabinose transferase-like glycosyltransferase
MFSGHKSANSPLRQALADKKLWLLLLILAVGAYLRLGHIQTLFNVMGDYDQGVYSLDARLLTQGYLPYAGFVLVHPPLYILVLAAVYKVFGYSLFAGKYFSAALSLVSIIFIYLIGKRISRPACGLAAAALFAVSPDMVYYGQRVVQEPLGIFLVIMAIYFGVLTLTGGGKKWAFISGICLGLAVATKYTFLPAFFAMLGVMLVFSLGEQFTDAARKLARPASLLIYASIAAVLIAILMVIQASFAASLPVPF